MNTSVLHTFDKAAATYEGAADVQRHIAARLAEFFPPLPQNATVWEVGCGTGLCSQHLIEKYNKNTLHLTDPSANMLAAAQQALPQNDHVFFSQTDALTPPANTKLDLIVACMSLHWTDNPFSTIAFLKQHLTPDGHLLYAAPGPENFKEWAAALKRLNLPDGRRFLEEENKVYEEKIEIDYNNLKIFFKLLNEMGGSTPATGHPPLSSKQFKQALADTQTHTGGIITWHTLYSLI